MEDDLNVVDAEAVSGLRTALVAGAGIDEALRGLAARYPAFWLTLFTEAFRRRFGPGCDVRKVTAFTARIVAKQAEAGAPLAARQAEALIRVALGEVHLVPSIEPEGMEYPGTYVQVLCSLFEQWQPDAGEVDALLNRTEAATAELRERAPGMLPSYERWLEGDQHPVPAAAAGSGSRPASDDGTGSRGESQAGEGGQVRPDQDGQDEGLARYNRVLARDPDDAWALTGRGLAYNARGRYEEALADFNRAIELDPSRSSAFSGRGDTYSFLGRYQDALHDFNRAVRLDADDYFAVRGRADVYRSMEHYQEALADYDRAIILNPDDTGGFSGRGLTYNLLGQYEEALADFTRVVELEPGNAWAIANRGAAYQYMDRYEEALAEYDHAIHIEPNEGWMAASRGDTYLALGRKAQALADYQRAVGLDPSLAEYLAPIITDLRAADAAGEE